MSKEVDWTKAIVAEARKHHASVTEAAHSRVEELLKTQLSERQIPAAELKLLASTLIDDMVPQQSEAESKE